MKKIVLFLFIFSFLSLNIPQEAFTMIRMPKIAHSKWAYRDDSKETSFYFFKIRDDAPEEVKKAYEEWKKEIDEIKALPPNINII
jgi:hypothetical protein